MSASFLAILLTITCCAWTFGQAQQAAPRSPCPHAIRLETNYQYRGMLHFICLQPQPNFNLRPRLEVVEYLTQKVLISEEVDELDIDQLASFVDDEGSLRILLAVPNRQNGTSMYSLDKEGRFIEERHTINTQYVSSLSIWRLNLNWEWHLAIANQPDLSALTANNQPIVGLTNNPSGLSALPQPVISIHSWRSTYFDLYQMIPLHPDSVVNKIEPMNINGQEFLIVATESSDYGSTSQLTGGVDSTIYKLDFGDGNLEWSLYQNLETKSALDVKAFVVAHQNSLQQDYYVALLGQLKPINKRTNPLSYQAFINRTGLSGEIIENENTLIIYKYFGDKFQIVDTIPALSANKLDAITYGGNGGDSYVVVALLSQYNSQIDLYLFDGLDIRRINSPYSNILAKRGQPILPRGRVRRTRMGLPVAHLFHAPNSSLNPNSSESTAFKRTLLNDEPQRTLQLPSLALANARPLASDSMVNRNGDQNNLPQSLYQIPVDTMIKDEQSQTAYNKRNSIADDSLIWCKTTINSLLADNFESTSQQILMMPKIDQQRPIELNGDLIIEGDLCVTNLLYVNEVFERVQYVNDSRISIEQSRYEQTKTFNSITQTHREIDDLSKEISQILVDDGSGQEFFNPVKFDTIVIECLNPINMDPRIQLGPLANRICPYIDEIETVYLNERDISDIQARAYLTGRSTTIDRDVRFEHLVLKGDVAILGTLNGLFIDNIVFKHGTSPGPINGTKHFRNGMFSSANLLVGNWNYNPVSRQNVLVSSGEQHIDSSVGFDRVIIDSSQAMPNVSSRIEKLNEVHLDTHLSQIAVGNIPNEFELPLTFDELILNGPVRFTQDSLLSSINLFDFWHNTMFKGSIQNVTAPMEFVGDVIVSHGGNIIVDGPVNGIVFRANQFVMRNHNATILNPVVFDDIDIQNLQMQTNNTLNGIQVVLNPFTGRHELAILYDHGDQLVTADKILGEIHLGGHSNITGLINEFLNLNQLFELTTSQEPFRFKNIHFRGNYQVSGQTGFHVEKINNFPAGDICSLANEVSEIPQTYYNKLKFNQLIHFKTLRCGTINRFNDLSRYFLTRHGNQHVAGTLRLINGAIFNTSINIQSTFNGLNIMPLSSAIAQANSENRTGHKEVFGNFSVDDLLTDRINNLELANVFLARADLPQIIRAPMSFDQLDIESILTVERNLVTYSFNGLNITDLVANTLQYDTPQTIFNHVYLDNLHISLGSNLATQLINGQNLRRLYNDAVLVDVPQQIMAEKTFRNQVQFKNKVYFRHSLDGLSAEKLRLNFLLQTDELLEGDLEFDNDVFVRKDLEIQLGLINDIDVNLFVVSMLYENRPDQNGLRILGNGSIRFKDVEVKNLVVGGTIQGIDLSKEAIMTSDNINGSYKQQLIDKQNMLNNLRLLHSGYGPGTSFWVKANYVGQPLIGSCNVKYCPPTTVQPPITGPTPFQHHEIYQTLAPTPVSQLLQLLPAPIGQTLIPRPIFTTQIYNQTLGGPVLSQQQQQNPPISGPIIINQEPIRYSQPFYPNFLPQPFSLVNNNLIKNTWTPQWNVINLQPNVINQGTYINQVNPHPNPYTNQNAYVNQSVIVNQGTHVNQSTFIQQNAYNNNNNNQIVPHNIEQEYLEHLSILQAQAISDLSLKINRYLSITFYYEIIQKHPHFGPVLNAAKNPIASEEDSALLLLKGTVKPGEPCLQMNQTVAIMAQRRHQPIFSLSSTIQTSSPTLVDSVVAGSNHYLFILDTHPTDGFGLMSRVMIHFWNNKTGLYELMQELLIHGFPTAMKAFVVNPVACIALANHKLVNGNNNHGSPMLFCQQSHGSSFEAIPLQIENVFDLDVVVQPQSSKILIAALSREFSLQIGDLIVSQYDFATGLLTTIGARKIAKPLKLHFIQNSSPRAAHVQLVVSEAMTSNYDARAITRIFSIRNVVAGPSGPFGAPGRMQLYESQIFKDQQFFDIQSVLLHEGDSLLFLQSTHSISIYAPLKTIGDTVDCDTQYGLAQKVPTKGANKFLVINDLSDRNHTNNNYSNIDGLLSHFLILSKEDCEQQQYWTLILKSKFK